MKFKMKNKRFLWWKPLYLMLLLVVLSPSHANAEEHILQQSDVTVRGMVSSESGEELIGVSVAIKGTATGTITAIDGSYEIRVPAQGATLVFSYIGFTTKEVKVGNATTLNVVLEEESALLSEVVIVGYGIQKKVNLTGSVSAVGADKITNRANASLSTSLSGLSTGLSVSQASGNPGSENVSFTIRGAGSFNNSSPMIIIDGAQASMGDINPDDVENISVLKDGASAAIYGARAANGVILITTKRGRQDEAPKITYSNLFASQKPVTSLKLMSDMPSWMEWHNIAQRNNDVNASVWYSDYLIDTWRAANSNPHGVDNGFGIPNWMAYPNTDWSKEMFQPSFFQRHNLAVSGGSKNSTYLLSVGYQDNPGTLDNTRQQRFNIRINTETTVAGILKFGTQTYLTKTKKDPGNASMSFLLQAYPGMIPEYNGYYGAGEDANQYDRQNVLRNVAAAGGKNENTTINTTWYAKGDIWNGISAEVKFNYQEITQDSEGYNRNLPLYSFRLGTQQPVNVMNTLEDTPITRSHAKTSSYLLNFFLHYDKRFGDHSINGLLGYEQMFWEKSGFRGRSEGMIDWNITDLPTKPKDTDQFYASPAKGDYAMISYFGRINYNYKGKYLLEANFRADAASKYAPGHRWGYFPSFSAGWRISEEEFYAPLKESINDLKLRGSWGKLGNIISANYPWQALYRGTNGVLEGEISNGLAQSQPSNYDLTWEKVSTFNIGFDALLLDHRMNLSVDYYQRHSADILDKPRMSLTLGVIPNAQWLNTSNMVNKGVEVSVGWNDKIEDFRYGATLNVSYNTNKVTRFRGALDYGPIDGQYDIWGRPVYGYVNWGDVSTMSGSRVRVEGHQIDEYYMNVPYKGSGKYYTADGKVDPKGGPKDGMIRTKADLEWVKSMIAAGYDFAGQKVGTPTVDANGNVTGGSGGTLWYGDQLMSDVNGDGVYGDSNDRKFIGKSATPKWNLGTVITAEWKGIDLSMSWEARLGSYAYLNERGVNGNISLPYDAIPEDAASVYYTYDAYKSVYDYDNYDPATDPHANINGKYPRLLAANSKSPTNTLYLQNTSFLKLRSLQVGYTLPKKWITPARLGNVRIYVAGENLLTIKNKNFRGVDPELGGSVIVYPLSRMFSGGINVTF